MEGVRLLACAHCRNGELRAGFDSYQCATCGEKTDAQGRAIPPEPKLTTEYEDTPWKDGRDSLGFENEGNEGG